MSITEEGILLTVVLKVSLQHLGNVVSFRLLNKIRNYNTSMVTLKRLTKWLKTKSELLKLRISRAITNSKQKDKPAHNCVDTVKAPSETNDKEHCVNSELPMPAF